MVSNPEQSLDAIWILDAVLDAIWILDAVLDAIWKPNIGQPDDFPPFVNQTSQLFGSLLY